MLIFFLIINTVVYLASLSSFLCNTCILNPKDGKSKDSLTMKEYEAEWMVYKKVMEDVIKRSGLNKNLFYDLRGNHDNFGVPKLGGLFDFYSRYSINIQLGRSGQVNSVTVEVSHFIRFLKWFFFWGVGGGIPDILVLNSESTTHNYVS